MMLRPTIFISAVSKELKSSRQLVSNTLQFLGYEPVWQDIFGTESGDLRAMLRQKIDGCKGVVQLVGKCYGAEPPAPDEQFGRVSYTQYEATYAKQRGKKVWYHFSGRAFFRATCMKLESGESYAKFKQHIVTGYQSGSQLYHPIHNSAELAASVLKLRDDLARLRRTGKLLVGGLAVLLIPLSPSVLFIYNGQKKQTQIIERQVNKIDTLSQKSRRSSLINFLKLNLK